MPDKNKTRRQTTVYFNLVRHSEAKRFKVYTGYCFIYVFDLNLNLWYNVFVGRKGRRSGLSHRRP